MKKLSLKLDGIKEMLTKEQMKKINGGYNGQDVRCIVFYTTPDDNPPIWTEFICPETTDTTYCASIATGTCPSNATECDVIRCYVF